jgi:hypothetical protein
MMNAPPSHLAPCLARVETLFALHVSHRRCPCEMSLSILVARQRMKQPDGAQ